MKISNRGSASKSFDRVRPNRLHTQKCMPFLSWSKINLFLQCPRCFYKEQIFKIKRPDVNPSVFLLHNEIDRRWKREMDQYRIKNEPHPLMVKYGIDAIPLNIARIYDWRDHRTGGIHYIDQERAIVLGGVIDDLLLNANGEIIILDFKTTEKNDFMVRKNNKRQVSFYAYLLKNNNFNVHDVGYLVCSRVIKNNSFFGQRLDFESTILSSEIDDSWVEHTLEGIRNCLNQSELPAPSKYCDVCKFTLN